jgi:hypothetical protein
MEIILSEDMIVCSDYVLRKTAYCKPLDTGRAVQLNSSQAEAVPFTAERVNELR